MPISSGLRGYKRIATLMLCLVFVLVALSATTAHAQSSGDPEDAQYGSPTTQLNAGGAGPQDPQASSPDGVITGLLPDTGGSSLAFLIAIVSFSLIGTGTLLLIRRRSESVG